MQRERRILQIDTRPLPADVPNLEGTAVRSPSHHDAEALARLMLDAYRGSIDDGGETLEDARAEVAKLLAGGYGRFDADASEVVLHGDRLVAATILTHYQDAPMLAFSLTDPGWRRRGLARSGILRAVRRLRDAGYGSLSLAVTIGNTPAERLYDSLGFVRA